MSDAVKYTITVGNNTSVTATKYEINDKQLKQLEALAQSGDISLDKTTGIITANTSHGLVAAGALMGVSFDELMAIDGLSHESNKATVHESIMSSINRFSSTNPEDMSLSELMTCMMMMVYMSESERREALQTAKGSQLLIQMDQARMAWSQSREAAEKSFDNALMNSIGTICSGVISAGMGIAGGIVQSRVNHYNKMAAKAEDDIKKADLAQQYKTAKNEADNSNDNFNQKVDAKAKENAQKIQQNDEKIKTVTEPEKANLESENQQLQADNAKLGYDAQGNKKNSLTVDYKKSSLQSDYAAKEAADKKVTDLEDKIKKMGGEIDQNGVIVDQNGKSKVPWGQQQGADGFENIDKEMLTRDATRYKEKASDLSTKVNMLQNVGVLGQVVAGGFQIGAAYAQKDAEFLRAEAQLTDAFRNFSAAMVQNIDSSAQQAIQQMEKLVSSLKEVFRAAYDIECSIARNI